MGTNYYINCEDNTVHIGRSSFGWQFIFQTNTNYYESNKLGINRFLKLHKDQLYDEYGTNINIKDFWELVEKKRSGVNLRTYHDYPHCLKFYDFEGERISEYMIKFDKIEDRVIYDRLPEYKSTLVRFIEKEILVDGLVFYNSEFT